MAYSNLPFMFYKTTAGNIKPTKFGDTNNLQSVSGTSFDTFEHINASYLGTGYIAGAFSIDHDTWANLPLNTEYPLVQLATGSRLILTKASTNHLWIRIKYNDNTYQMILGTDNWPLYRYNMNIFFALDEIGERYRPYFLATKEGGIDTLLMPGSTTLTYTEWNKFINGSVIDSLDPYATAPQSEGGGGYGDFDYTSDDIDFSDLPTLSVVDSGFVTLYNPSMPQLKELAQYMWSGLFDINTFRKIFADPMDCIISLAMIPLTPSTAAAQELKVGNVGTGISINRLNSQFVEVNFAMKNIGLRTNGFMDFSPYTKAQIFLPYIGIRSLSIDDIAGKDLTLKYKIDLFTGACNAALKCGGSVLYQFTGNVIANIPITAQNFSGMLQAAIGAVGAAVGVATGAGALAGVASAVNAATSMKPDIERSGNLSATSGFLGQQVPYLILTYPNLCRPGGRDKTVGTPSFLGLSTADPVKPLSSFHGITKLHKINVRSIPCTDAERDEIEAVLTEGVILP